MKFDCNVCLNIILLYESFCVQMQCIAKLTGIYVVKHIYHY